jgi:hypothetical protein
MSKWLAAMGGFLLMLTIIWWPALIVLAIKGLLFNRHDNPPIPAPDAAEELPPPLPGNSLPRGCVWALIFVFWPMVLGGLIDEWLKRKWPNL